MALLILALLQRIFLMSSLMLLLVWLIFFMVLIKLLPILGTISGKTVKLMVLALICLGNNRQDLAIKLCRLDTPIIFIEARINLSRFVVTGCAAKTSATVTFPSLNLISLFAFCFNIWLNGVAS